MGFLEPEGSRCLLYQQAEKAKAGDCPEIPVKHPLPVDYRWEGGYGVKFVGMRSRRENMLQLQGWREEWVCKFYTR